MNDDDRVDDDEQWRIEELDVQSEVYAFFGRAAPYGSSAVSKAKKQFADDNDFDYNDVTGQKVSSPPSRDHGAIVLVVHDPESEAKRVFP